MASVNLIKPLEYYDPAEKQPKTLTELTLREPTVGDVCKHGYPFSISQHNGRSQVEIQPATVLAYIGELSGLSPVALKGLSLADFSAMQSVVMDFFGGAAEAETT